MTPTDLLRQWERMVEPWGAGADDVLQAGRTLLACYAEPHRRYHTTEHLIEVLVMAGDLIDLAADPVAVELAAWFHDAVYDPRAGAGGNEAASADLVTTVLGPLGVKPSAIENTRRLVMTTIDHRVDPDDVDAAVLLDADLWILGSPERRYRRYSADVRTEHAWLDQAAWRSGRSAILSGLLGRGRIYATRRAHDALDSRARQNLAAELAALGGGEPQP